MKNPMFRVIAVHPEILQADRSRFVLGLAEENLQAGRKSRGKIGEQFGQNFTFVAARTMMRATCTQPWSSAGGFNLRVSQA